MTFFYTIKLKHVKRYFVIIVFTILTITILAINGGNHLSVFSSQDGPVGLARGNENNEDISLTFNVTWGDQMIEPILDQLNEHDVQATFFLLGEWAEHHPHLIELIDEAGHEIGMLGYRYKSYLDLDNDAIVKDLHRAQDVFNKLGYTDLNLLRTPSGHLDEDVLTIAVKQGYDVIQWRVNSNDWKAPGVDNIVDEVISETKNGDIILMHASDSAIQTAESLALILPTLKEKGFKFISVSELISQADIETDPVE
ncbi:polysaccharide deacetylase family sporulation protein PdaB [Amphibacillus cookii]|uniref:polysaccharide deacetylase family sporulation protein PdaB n=1 Tax=Amphibacillus cookii TaxID=767787 RepID=UPI001EF91C18|nr:polysaccharide deacetylase family sporulation protein PdaB [Amphibacillus cookii]MBM7542744.1 polysaccharide deacetylase family sporulation protein PdaB [Amphibacillus cookii]